MSRVPSARTLAAQLIAAHAAGSRWQVEEAFGAVSDAVNGLGSEDAKGSLFAGVMKALAELAGDAVNDLDGGAEWLARTQQECGADRRLRLVAVSTTPKGKAS
jgi:hypothetical protein